MRCLYLCSSSSSESLHLNWHSSQQYSIMSASWRLQLSWGVRTIGKPRPRLSFEVLFIKESLCYGFQGRVNIKMVETPGHRAPPPPRWGPRTPSAGTRGAWCGGRGCIRGWRWSRGCRSLACSHHHHHLLEMRTTYNIMLDNRSERWQADLCSSSVFSTSSAALVSMVMEELRDRDRNFRLLEFRLNIWCCGILGIGWKRIFKILMLVQIKHMNEVKRMTHVKVKRMTHVTHTSEL